MAKQLLSLDERLHQLHDDACAKGRKAYRDPITKCRVCTADFLLSRGVCCGCDCRHCPFPAEEKARAAAQHGYAVA